MLVDPEILRAFADQVVVASTAIRQAEVGNKVSTAADGLAGSATQWAARLTGGHVAELTDDIAVHVGEMGMAVRGAGNTYHVTDSDLAGNFDRIF